MPFGIDVIAEIAHLNILPDESSYRWCRASSCTNHSCVQVGCFTGCRFLWQEKATMMITRNIIIVAPEICIHGISSIQDFGSANSWFKSCVILLMSSFCFISCIMMSTGLVCRSSTALLSSMEISVVISAVIDSLFCSSLKLFFWTNLYCKFPHFSIFKDITKVAIEPETPCNVEMCPSYYFCG